MIGVVIPYFQRQTGVLKRALASVAAQRGCALPVRVIVVDDESPVPVAKELEGFDASGLVIEVLAQPNGGPGAARNAALDHLPSNTSYVAFLDSDDEWSDDHLSRAIVALDTGFDFYFANHYQLGQTIGAFERAGRIRPADHSAISRAEGLHRYEGDLFDKIVKGNVIGTSTVVYLHAKFAGVRFRTELTSAGEDYLFWMTLVKNGARAAFSTKIEAVYGRGVNIYSGVAWASDDYLVRLRHEIAFRKTAQMIFEMDDSQRRHIRGSMTQLRSAFALSLLHRLRHRQMPSRQVLFDHWRIDPLSFAVIPAAGIRAMLGRV